MARARLATRIERTKAFLIDLFLLYVPILYVFYFVLGGKQAFLENQAIIAFCWCFFGLIQALFFTFKAQSPGLKAYDLYLIDKKAKKKLSFIRAFMRYLIFLFGSALFFGFIMSFLRSDKLCFWDIVSKTYIIKKES